VQNYDVVVIGGGSTGQKAALAAGPRKHKVALIDQFGTNGANNYLGKMIEEFAKAAREEGSFQSAANAAKHCRTEFLQSQPHKRALQAAGIAVITGRAEQVSPTQIQVGTEQIRAKKIIIATGQPPITFEITGASCVQSTEAIFDLTTQPDRLIFINPSPTHLTLTEACRWLGVKVNLIVTTDPNSPIKLESIQKLQRSYRLYYLADNQPTKATAKLIIAG